MRRMGSIRPTGSGVQSPAQESSTVMFSDRRIRRADPSERATLRSIGDDDFGARVAMRLTWTTAHAVAEYRR